MDWRVDHNRPTCGSELLIRCPNGGDEMPVSFARRALIGVALALLGLSVAYFLYQTASVLVLLFAGVMLAVFLDGITRLLRRLWPVGRAWALLIAVLGLLALLVVSIWLLGAPLADQLATLTRRIPESGAELQARLKELPWGPAMLERLPDFSTMIPGRKDIIAGIFGVFSTAFGALVSAFVIISLGAYFALSPRVYVGAARRLVPPARRRRVDEVAEALGRALRHWLVGRLFSMLTVGVLTGIGLWAIGMPLPLSLAFITALAVFVPYIGPIISFVPALAIAISESFTLAFYVGFLYLGVQLLESYVITPMIQRRAVSLPPGFLVSAQVVAGVLFGGFGVALAAPFAVLLTVLVQMLYVVDVLGDDTTTVLGDEPIFHTGASTRAGGHHRDEATNVSQARQSTAPRHRGGTQR